MTKRARQQQQDEAARARRARELARHLAVENHRLHALNCPICQTAAVTLVHIHALVTRVASSHPGVLDTKQR